MAAFSMTSVLPPVSSFMLILLSLSLYHLYHVNRKFSYWKKRGVPHVTRTLFAHHRLPPALKYQRIYEELNGHKFGGFYELTNPTLMLRDPELINSILTKHFPHFHDRGFHFDEKLDPLTANIVNLTGKRWRNVRYKLTPVFSSGKLRLMQDLMKDCIEELDEFLNNVTGNDVGTGSVQDMREVMAKFTTDVIGSCAFGFRCNSIRDENSEFRRAGRLIFEPSRRRYILNLLLRINPWLARIFSVKKHAPEMEEFFLSVIHEAIKYREATAAQKRNDFLQLMIKIQAEEQRKLQRKGHQQTEVDWRASDESLPKSSDILFTDTIVAANAFAFFAGGFETSSSTLSYCLYELALNPDICEKLRHEVESVKQTHNGELDYDALKELVYMDAVVSETLRKYPTFHGIHRKCNEAFQIPGSCLVIEKGTDIHVSIYALHHDPKYFPEPEKFLPERFSKENKHSIKPGSYLPFGDGPRICIGMRFALFEIKTVLSYLVSNFTVHSCEKTVIPLQFDCRSSLMHVPSSGIWVRMQRR